VTLETAGFWGVAAVLLASSLAVVLTPNLFHAVLYLAVALVATGLVFLLLDAPFLFGVQLLLPRAPVLMGGYAAITWSMCLYEILHAIEHRPYEWWKHATEHPRFGAFWRKLYGFHHMHHANISCNEAISGFFGWTTMAPI